jgi:thiol-disulfide isomerase/thioredoxin
MQQFINQYSFVFLALSLIFMVAFLGGRFVGTKYALSLAVVCLFVLVGLQMYLSTNTDGHSSMKDFEEATLSQKPVLLFLYSDFWVGCLKAKPAVDRLEIKLEDDFAVIRANISSELGAHVRSVFDIGVVPTFIVIDQQQQEIWRQIGTVPALDVIRALDFWLSAFGTWMFIDGANGSSCQGDS